MPKLNNMGEFVQAESEFSYAPPPMEVKARMLASLMRTGKLRYCDVCGKPFKPREARNVYCSFACRLDANRYRARQRKRRLRAGAA